MAAPERMRAMPRSVANRQRIEHLEGVIRDLDTLLSAAAIGPMKAGYPGSMQTAMFRLECARDKARAAVEEINERGRDEC